MIDSILSQDHKTLFFNRKIEGFRVEQDMSSGIKKVPLDRRYKIFAYLTSAPHYAEMAAYNRKELALMIMEQLNKKSVDGAHYTFILPDEDGARKMYKEVYGHDLEEVKAR